MQNHKTATGEKGDPMQVKTNVIKLYAAMQNMQLYELADRAGISRTTLSNILTRGTASAPSIIKIADALSVRPSFLAVKEKHHRND